MPQITLGEPIGALVAVLGILASLMALAAVFLPVYEITVNTLPCEPAEVELAEQCSQNGSIALLPLAALALLMALGAGPGGSRPATWALIATGAAILLLILVFDLPKLGTTGQIGSNFEAAATAPGAGFWLELLAGLLAVGAGVLRFVLPWQPEERPPRGAAAGD
jgi:hypothetical protein